MIRHRESGKTYIGRAKNIPERWALHRRDTERKKTRAPLHRALAKYGYDAFEWKVLVTAPPELHERLEAQFISDWGTFVPAGYNVGSARGGVACRELIDQLPDKERLELVERLKKNARKAQEALAKRRADPEYEAQYLARMKAAAIAREIARRERIANDPEYAAKEASRRRKGGLLSLETKRAREALDPALKAARSIVQSRAAKRARASDPRTLRAAERRRRAEKS